jgi:hypothetical protein
VSTVYGKPKLTRRLANSIRRHRLYWIAIATGIVLMLGSISAYAAFVLRGTGTLTAKALQTRPLLVSGEHLAWPLSPGKSSDLVFKVRNPNDFDVVIDHVGLNSTLRKANPAGCTKKVSGPLLRSSGYSLSPRYWVNVPAGRQVTVTAPGALRLADSAPTGCGFTVDIYVRGAQAAPPPGIPSPRPTSPTPAPPTTTPAPTLTPTSAPPATSASADSDDTDGPPPVG